MKESNLSTSKALSRNDVNYTRGFAGFSPRADIHINGIADGCKDCESALYADDTEIHATSKDIDVAEQRVNQDFASIVMLWNQNWLISNHNKCEAMLIGSRYTVKNTRGFQIIFDGNPMKQSEYYKHLGVYIDNCLTWNKQITSIKSKFNTYLAILLNKISHFLSRNVLLKIYLETVLPLLDYGCVVGYGLNAERETSKA